MSLERDKIVLKNQIRELQKTDDDARNINKRLRTLEEAIGNDIQSDKLSIIMDALSGFYDIPAASMNDANINQAQSNINAEIRTIEAVLRARKKAAAALSRGSK